MAPQPPDYRARRILTAIEDGEQVTLDDSMEIAFFHLVKNGESAMPELASAYDIYQDQEYRHIINALALSGANPESVAAALGMPEPIYRAYVSFFFDVNVFPHNLAKARYVRQVQCADELKKVYEVAIERGAEELLSRYQIGARPRMDPEDVMHGAMADMWSKFLSHRGYSVTADTAKEALKWGESAVRVAKMLGDGSREAQHARDAANELRIALEVRSTTKTLEELDIKPDDLVTE
jgi:hypothetical protein